MDLLLSVALSIEHAHDFDLTSFIAPERLPPPIRVNASPDLYETELILHDVEGLGAGVGHLPARRYRSSFAFARCEGRRGLPRGGLLTAPGETFGRQL